MSKRLDQLLAANEALKAEIAERIENLERTESIARISDENPNPVMRVNTIGHVLYANKPAEVMLEYWGRGCPR